MKRLTQTLAEISAGATASERLTQIVAETVADLPILSNCRLTEIVAEIVTPACERTQLVGGSFQDAEGNPLAGGTVVFQVSCDAVSCAGQLVSGGRETSVTLDSTGNIPSSPAFFLWGNSTLSNQAQTPYYLMSVYSASGQLALRQPITIPVTQLWTLGT